MVHGDRAVNRDLDEGVTRLFARDAVRKDTTRAYQEQEEEELRSQLAGTVGEDRPEAGLEQLEESRNERSERRKLNMEDVEPRRSLRLAKKKVTIRRLGTVDDPEVLPYYMAAIESGYAGTRQNNPRVFSEEEEARTPDIGEQQELIVQEEAVRQGQGGGHGAGHREYGGAVGQLALGLHGSASILHTCWEQHR
jgi:hypothetical protein